MDFHDARPGEHVPDVPPPAGAPQDAAPQRGTPENGVGQAESSPAARCSAERRQLSFRASGLTIELEITGNGGGWRLAGQLIPRQSAIVEIRTAGGVITAEADSLGRFSVDNVPFGPVSLRCRLGNDTDQSPVVTGWIAL